MTTYAEIVQRFEYHQQKRAEHRRLATDALLAVVAATGQRVGQSNLFFRTSDDLVTTEPARSLDIRSHSESVARIGVMLGDQKKAFEIVTVNLTRRDGGFQVTIAPRDEPIDIVDANMSTIGDAVLNALDHALARRESTEF